MSRSAKSDPFWESHLSFSEVSRKLGGTRQNWHQRARLTHSCPCDLHPSTSEPGVPISWVEETIKLREKGGSNGTTTSFSIKPVLVFTPEEEELRTKDPLQPKSGA